MAHHPPPRQGANQLAQQLQAAARPEHHTTGIAATRDSLEIPPSDTPEQRRGFWQLIKKLLNRSK